MRVASVLFLLGLHFLAVQGTLVAYRIEADDAQCDNPVVMEGFWNGRCWSIGSISQKLTCVDPEGDFNLIKHEIWNSDDACNGTPSQTLTYSGGKDSCPATDFDSLGRKVYFSCHKPKTDGNYATFASFSGSPCAKSNFVTARLSKEGLCLEDEDGSFYRHTCNATTQEYTAWEGCVDDSCTICERTAETISSHHCSSLGDQFVSAGCLDPSTLPKAFFEEVPQIKVIESVGGPLANSPPPPDDNSTEPSGETVDESAGETNDPASSGAESTDEESQAEEADASAAASARRSARAGVAIVAVGLALAWLVL